MLTIIKGVILVIIVVVGVIALRSVLKTIKKHKATRPLTIEEKIMLLNKQLSAGIITKEEYDMQKADLLKNI